MNTGRVVLLRGIAEVIARASSLVTFPIMARYVGADGYGALGQVNTLVGFVIPFSALGLSGGTLVRYLTAQRWTNHLRGHLIRFSLLIVLTGGIISVLVSFAAPHLNHFILKWPGGDALFRWGAFLIVFGAVEQMLFDFMRSRQWLIQYSILQIFHTLFVVFAIVWVLPQGLGLVTLIQWNIGIKFLLISTVYLGCWSWKKPEEAIETGSFPTYGQMIRFGFPLAFSSLGLWLMNLGDRFVIGHYMLPQSLGIYAAVYNLSLVLVAINAPFNLPLYPRLMKAIAAKDQEGLSREIRVFHRYVGLILIPSMVLIWLVIKPLLLILGGK